MSQCDSSGEIIRIKLKCSKLTMIYLEIPMASDLFLRQVRPPHTSKFLKPQQHQQREQTLAVKRGF